MALVHTTAIRNGVADYVVDAIDVGGTGYLEFQEADDSEAATVTFQAVAFDDAGAAGGNAAGVATADTIISDTNAAGGTVDRFRIYSGAAVEILQGTVLTSGGDINLSSLVVGATDTVSMSSLTYTAPV
jgi:hypothetical protein